MRQALAPLFGVILAVLGCAMGAAAEDLRSLPVLYLRIAQPERATLSNLDPIPADLGLRGAQLALADNNTTGSFLGYRFTLDLVDLAADDVAGARAALAASTSDYVLLDMSASQMSDLVNGANDRLFFNIRAYDDNLRAADCRAMLLHTLPSYAMRADALMQFVYKKRWDNLVLVEGNTPQDARFAEALRKAAAKFRLGFASDVTWIFDADMRRNAGAEVPVFTQQLGEYDALIVADEWNDFARYLAYNTWQPRPILGGDGLRATGWDRVNEQWGAAQLQGRFQDLANRVMQDVDYAAWAAMRAIDEAQVRTKFADLKTIRQYLLTDLELGGFKGRPLSFRSWNGQLRQPIGLTHATALVAMAPLEGFLHARNELDSLGADAPESQCNAFED